MGLDVLGQHQDADLRVLGTDLLCRHRAPRWYELAASGCRRWPHRERGRRRGSAAMWRHRPGRPPRTRRWRADLPCLHGRAPSRRRALPQGSTATTLVPNSGVLSIDNVPPRATTRSSRPRSPLPAPGRTAPPSSWTSTRRRPSTEVNDTIACEAPAWRTMLARASATRKYPVPRHVGGDAASQTLTRRRPGSASTAPPAIPPLRLTPPR